MPGWVDLHVHSNYSFLDGASDVDDLADAAVEQGLEALALTDTNGLYGAVRFAGAAKERGLRPIFGAELQLQEMGHVVLIARDRLGWTSLCRTISAAQLAGEKTKPKATFELLAENAAGLFALTGCAHGAVPRAVRAGDLDTAREALARLGAVFGDRLYVELSDHLDPDAPALCDTLASLAGEMGLGCVVTNNVHYARPEGRRLHDVLRCIDLGVTLDEAGQRLKPNGEYWLKGEAMLRERLGRFDEAFRNAREIADSCVLDLLYDTNTPRAEASMAGQDRLPGFAVPQGHTAFSYLYALCQEGAREKYGLMTPNVAMQLAHELSVIDRCGLAEFFLINWDIVRFCKERRIPAQGRVSATNSIVEYVLDIPKFDPIEHDLLFERFLTEDSRTMPDIDLDIATNDREEVIQYVYTKYGERYAAMVCNVVTYRARSASREVAKALGFRAETIDRMAKSIDQYHVDPTIYPSAAMHPAYRHPGREAEHGWEGPRALPDTLEGLLEIFDAKERERFPLFRELTLAIADFPRHLSIHNGGMLITAQPLVDTVPIERATMPGRNVAQFDKRDVEDLGLVKMDLLGLRTLSLVKDAVADIEARHGERLDLGTIPMDDPAVYDLICEVDTIGLFQVESRAQAQALPRVRPRCFADIVVEVAIIRPGPLQGNAVNPYIRRRQGKEPVSYAHPLLEPVLKETLGVILFQEQILRVAMTVAGFSPAAADLLRRAMSRARSSADMERLRGPFVDGARRKGVDEKTANEIFHQIAGFAEFGFCKSHAAAFALTAYHTAHLKLYYPAEFYVALFNNQPMGFYSPAVIAGDAKRHGVAILPVDVNASSAKAIAEVCDGAGTDGADEARGVSRGGAGLSPSEPAVRGSEPSDRTGRRDPRAREIPREASSASVASSAHPVDTSRTIADHRKCRSHDVRLGFESVKELGDAEAKAIVEERGRGGPFKGFDDFAARAGLKEEALRNLAPVGELVHIAGAVVVKQHPETAKGHVFLSLEDETGMANVIIRPATYQRYKRVLDSESAIVVAGALQTVDGVISVLAKRLDGLRLFVKIAAREWQ